MLTNTMNMALQMQWRHLGGRGVRMVFDAANNELEQHRLWRHNVYARLPGNRNDDMKPDFSFELYFDLAARPAALEALKRLCREDYWHQLDQAKAGHDHSRLNLLFRVPYSQGLAEYVEWTPETLTAEGYVLLGAICGSVSSEEHPELDQIMTEVWLWPAASLLQRACFGSQYIRDVLVEILETHQGVSGYIRDSGYMTLFWSNTEGRMQDSYPLGPLA